MVNQNFKILYICFFLLPLYAQSTEIEAHLFADITDETKNYNSEYWNEKCKLVPSDALYIKMEMGSNIDYFKPMDGHSFCEMLTSTQFHLWSPDTIEWTRPETYPVSNGMLGGSAADWPKHAGKFDGRRWIPTWGTDNSAAYEGGCCNYSKTDTAGWKRKFKMYAVGSTAIQGPIGTDWELIDNHFQTYYLEPATYTNIDEALAACNGARTGGKPVGNYINNFNCEGKVFNLPNRGTCTTSAEFYHCWRDTELGDYIVAGNYNTECTLNEKSFLQINNSWQASPTGSLLCAVEITATDEELEVCTESSVEATGSDCDCGGNECSGTEFCYNGICNADAKACTVSTVAATGEQCQCSVGNICRDDQFCYNGICNEGQKGCTVSNIATTGEECECSGNICRSDQFCYKGSCNNAAKDCPISYVDALTEDCMCEDQSCAANNFCHSGGCQTSKCIARSSKRMFYGSTLHGSWDSEKKSMKTYIETPFEVSIKSITWRNAETDALKYTQSNTGFWNLDRTSEMCKIRYTLDVNQATFFGKGSKFSINGQQMKSYITVDAQQEMNEEQHGHTYKYTRHISNLIPVLVNLRATTQVSVKFTVLSPSGGDEFVLFLDAVDETAEEGGSGKVIIVMEVHSKNCVDTEMNAAASQIINGVRVKSGLEHIRSGVPSTFAWKTIENADGELVLEEKFLYDYCVQTVQWAFIPADLTATTNTFDITLEFQNRQSSTTFEAIATVDLEVADVLGDIGFDGTVTLYEDRQLQSPEQDFYLGEKFWAKIVLEQMIVDADSMQCTSFEVSQTIDGVAEKTDMKSLPQYNFEEYTPPNTVNTIVCGAELDSPHFHKSENGKDSELLVEVTIQYKQGEQERRILRASLNQEPINEDAVGSAEDNAFAQATRDPDTTDLSAAFSIKGFDPIKVVETLEKETTNVGSKNFANKFYLAISIASVMFGTMLVLELWRKQKLSNESIQLLLYEDDI